MTESHFELNLLPKLGNWIGCRKYYNKSDLEILANDQPNYKLMGTDNLLKVVNQVEDYKLTTTNKLNHTWYALDARGTTF